MSVDLDRLEAAIARLPKPTYVVESGSYEQPYADWPEPSGCAEDREATLSPSRGADGWRTDGGCPGYGLPAGIARAIADILDAAPALIAEIRELRAKAGAR